VRGALTKLRTSIFAAEPADVDADSEYAELLRGQQTRTTAAIIHHLGQEMDQRAERLRRLRDLWRCPYSFRDLLAELSRRGVEVPEGEPGRAERERWGQVHRLVSETHREYVNHHGLELATDGHTEAGAIAALERRRGEFAERARANAHRALKHELGY
jgi:hypothetical protein